MKRVIALILIIFVSVNCIDKQKSKTVENSVDDNRHTEFARSISDNILSAQKAGGFYKLTEEEATERMITSLDENLQKLSYSKIKSMFGDYKTLKLDTVLQITKDKTYHIYRFIGDFETNHNVEVRTVLDLDGKLAGFFVLPWKDTL